MNRNLSKSLYLSRKGNKPARLPRPNLAPVRLNSKQAKFLANLSASSSNTQEMLDNLQKLQMYLLIHGHVGAAENLSLFGETPSVTLNPNQQALLNKLYRNFHHVERMENSLDKIKNRILATS